MSEHIPRTLSYTGDKGELHHVSDAEIADFAEPLIVLGEPGMGKSWLLDQLAARHGWHCVSVASFLRAARPGLLVPPGGRLVLDGLDEVAAARDTDPVDQVLKHLNAAERPPFVLSCRVADWRAASARRDVAEDYGVKPIQLQLLPFSRGDALNYLSMHLPFERAEAIISHLDEKGVSDLYGNPFSLELFMEIASATGELPKTRGDLLRQAASTMWRDRSDRRVPSPLLELDEASALSAAGAACAAWLLCGVEALSILPRPGDVGALAVAELQTLPGAAAVRTVLGSKLFRAVAGQDGWYKPFHRTFAEFIAARWLSNTCRTTEARERVLALMTIQEGIPASLRGLHSWLAQDAQFAETVIKTDPYGVLRYGDADNLTLPQARQLLDELKALSKDDPLFRADDWGRHPAQGLMQASLATVLEEALLDQQTGFHLRTLLLEAIHGSAIAGVVAPTLWQLACKDLGLELSYAERIDALLAWASHFEGPVEWLDYVREVLASGVQGSPRMGGALMIAVGLDAFDDQALIEVIISFVAPSSVDNEDTIDAVLQSIGRHLPLNRIPSLLDAMQRADEAHLLDPSKRYRNALGNFVDLLICYGWAPEGFTPGALLRWLGIRGPEASGRRQHVDELTEKFEAAHPMRHAVQYTALFDGGLGTSVRDRIIYLEDLLPVLGFRVDDLLHHLLTLPVAAEPEMQIEATWRALISFFRFPDQDRERIAQAARPYAAADPARLAFFEQTLRPQPLADWQVRHHERERRAAAESARAQEERRSELLENVAALRAGDPHWISIAADVYFGEGDRALKSLSPRTRVEQYLGPELAHAAFLGFEAILKRTDLLGIDQVATQLANRRYDPTWEGIAAGLQERCLNGIDLQDLDHNLLLTARLVLRRLQIGSDFDNEPVRAALERVIFSEPALHERLLRLLVEPALERTQTTVDGLDEVLEVTSNAGLAVKLAAEWLRMYPAMASEPEAALISFLSRHGRSMELLELAHSRQIRTESSNSEEARWLAVRICHDPVATLPTLAPLGPEDRDLLWDLRRLLGRDGRSATSSRFSALPIGWTIATFRELWPRVDSPRSAWWGSKNAWDASHFLLDLINCLAGEPSGEAASVLEKLRTAPADGYSPDIRHAWALQRQLCRESQFTGIPLDRLRSALADGPPKSIDDFVVVLQQALRRLQRELRGNETDTVEKYWEDAGAPRLENVCNDRLVEDLTCHLSSYRIGRITQADMPIDKRADILYTVNDLALPVECKGQWNDELWTAPIAQLDKLYLRDHRASDRGIYLVYWFGPVDNPDHRLKSPPKGIATPTTPEALQAAIVETLPPERRSSLLVEVLDLTRPAGSGVRVRKKSSDDG